MRVLEQSPANVNILYAARDDKKLFRTEQCNSQSTSWTDLSANLPENTSINDLEAHPYDENIVYLAQGTNLYKSTDKGMSWQEISGNLPNSNITSIAYYKNSQEGLYVSTDIGIFYKDAFLSDWILFDNGFPASSRVTEVEIYYDTLNPQNDAIRASTYGRGLWSSDMYHTACTADFSANQQVVPITCPVIFSDKSSGVPTSWLWTFEGGNPATSNQPGPIEVVYENAGVFDVTLTVTNEFGSNTKLFEDMITVSDEIIPLVSFDADQKIVCTGTTISFTDHSQFCPTAWLWTFYPTNVVFAGGTTPESQNPKVIFQENTNYSVTLKVWNINGTSSLTEEDYILSGGYQLPFFESFETGIFSVRGWATVNPDGLKTWEITAPIYSPHGTNAAMMDFYNYFKLNERDQLISPPINLEGETNAVLSFKYAYSQRFSQKDSLIVKVSDDCGENWTRIYWNGPDGNGIFETALPTTSFFDPATSADWCGEGYGAECVNLPLNIANANCRLMFESFNRYGNTLYLDEISISTTTSVLDLSSQNQEIDLFPNPGKGIFTIRFNRPSSSVRVLITDIHGKKILTRSIENCDINHTEIFDIETFPKGTYIVHIQGDQIITNSIFLKL
jgi:PKD repeat protein